MVGAYNNRICGRAQFRPVSRVEIQDE